MQQNKSNLSVSYSGLKESKIRKDEETGQVKKGMKSEEQSVILQSKVNVGEVQLVGSKSDSLKISKVEEKVLEDNVIQKSGDDAINLIAGLETAKSQPQKPIQKGFVFNLPKSKKIPINPPEQTTNKPIKITKS